LARNGTAIIKFWMNIFQKEQRKRLLSRLDEPDKKLRKAMFWSGNIGTLLCAPPRKRLPPHPGSVRPGVLPVDHKPYMHYCLADIFVRSFNSLGLIYPRVDAEQEKKLQKNVQTARKE
jgi:hypothetical protein